MTLGRGESIKMKCGLRCFCMTRCINNECNMIFQKRNANCKRGCKWTAPDLLEHLHGNRWNLWIFNKFQIFDILKFYWIIPSKRLEAFKNVYFACNVITHVYLLTFIHFIRQISWHVSRTYRQTGWLADWHEHTPLPSSVLVLQIWRFQMIFSVYVRKNILRN